jgi:hypothetical protein
LEGREKRDTLWETMKDQPEPLLLILPSSSFRSVAVMNTRQPLPYAARVALLAAAYFLTGRLGMTLPAVGTHITLVWPPTGVALAALLCWGLRYWPGVWLGSFLVNVGGGPLLAGAPTCVAPSASIRAASPSRSASARPRWTSSGRCRAAS